MQLIFLGLIIIFAFHLLVASSRSSGSSRSTSGRSSSRSGPYSRPTSSSRSSSYRSSSSSRSGTSRPSFSKSKNVSGARGYSGGKTHRHSPKKNNEANSLKSGTYVIQNQKTGNIYVGRSKDIEKRVQQHNRGTGAKYTAREGPHWKLVRTVKGNNNRVENSVVNKYIRIFGLKNVRGGPYCARYYSRRAMENIERASRSSTNENDKDKSK